MAKLVFNVSIYMKQMTSADDILTFLFVTCELRLTLNAAALTSMKSSTVIGLYRAFSACSNDDL